MKFRGILVALLAAVAALAAPAAAQVGRRAEKPWWQRTTTRTSEHYFIRTDLPRAEARAYGRHLDFMYREFSWRLASLPPRGPEQLDVYIFARRSEYLRTLAGRWGIDGKGSGGMFFVNQQGSGLAFWTEDLAASRVHHVIQHEGFHQFAFSRFGNDLPLWLNEGLAEFFGEAVRVGDRLVLGQSTPRVIDRVKNAIERNEHVPFSAMLRMSNQTWNENVKNGDAAIYYNQAWSMVHFLVYADETRYQPAFERYLRLLNNGIPSEEAFVQVFGGDLDAFEKQWKRYALAAKPSAFVTAVERIEFIAAGALHLSRQQVVPTSLDDLAEALRSIDFEHHLERHGVSATLAAKDADNFVIPMDDLTREQPVFVVEEPKRRRLSRRGRLREASQPMPAAISTKHLRPRGLSIRWSRDRETGQVSYEIVTRSP
ncbi:MAG: DUF1570 domain-containing protein [Planctomycetes bacterium]|nr:DUF1570 domain-containing protein [Planctomycetota bacterium]